MKKCFAIACIIIFVGTNVIIADDIENEMHNHSESDYGCQWEHDYGKIPWWSARYEGPQPIGDADNDGKNEFLIGGRDPFLRVMKWNDVLKTYITQAWIMDPILGIGYGIWLRIGEEYRFIPIPTGSPNGFAIGDVDNDGLNEIAVSWGRHFSAFKWNGFRYKKIGMYVIADDEGWQSTLDCVIGDCDNDGENEVVITGSYSSSDIPEVIVLSWDGKEFIKESSWNPPGRKSVYFPWIADVDEDGENEIICGPDNELVVLNWNGEEYFSTVLSTYHTQVFGCVSKDSDNDGKPEIHVTFWEPELEIWEWNGTGYEKKYECRWEGEEATIEAIDVGDVDDDGIPEVCVGTNHVHILQWNGVEYEEEAVISETFGLLAVTAVGDTDNDGKLEINAGSVGVPSGQPYKEWIFKYGYGELGKYNQINN